MSDHPLKKYRKGAGCTQKQLAELLGVVRETVARWEAGRKIDDQFVPLIAERTGIAPRELRPDLAEMLDDAP